MVPILVSLIILGAQTLIHKRLAFNRSQTIEKTLR
jgi:hypothetical protein